MDGKVRFDRKISFSVDSYFLEGVLVHNAIVFGEGVPRKRTEIIKALDTYLYQYGKTDPWGVVVDPEETECVAEKAEKVCRKHYPQLYE